MKTRRMIVMLLCVVMIAGMMTGCQKKIPQTAAEFTQIMETAGLAVRDNTGNGDENDKLTAKLYAIDENYTIEYYAFEDSGAAQRVYNSNYRTFDEENPVKTLSAKMTTSRYDYCAFTAGGQFYVIARIENTLVGCVADAEYKQEILSHIKALGYK